MGSDELWEIVTGSVGGSALDNRGKVVPEPVAIQADGEFFGSSSH